MFAHGERVADVAEFASYDVPSPLFILPTKLWLAAITKINNCANGLTSNDRRLMCVSSIRTRLGNIITQGTKTCDFIVPSARHHRHRHPDYNHLRLVLKLEPLHLRVFRLNISAMISSPRILHVSRFRPSFPPFLTHLFSRSLTQSCSCKTL